MDFHKDVRHYAKQGRHDHVDNRVDEKEVFALSSLETELKEHVKAQQYDKEREGI